MSDFMTPEQRSRAMSKVRGGNTKPEIIIRSHLHQIGFRFRLHSQNLPGKPDIVLKKYNAAIFVHGCFWHNHKNCKKAILPQTNKNFWAKKIKTTVQRDRKNISDLANSGWRIAVIWECATKNIDVLGETLNKVNTWLQGEKNNLECFNQNFGGKPCIFSSDYMEG